MIPATRAEARGLRVVLWALFGNDDGGLYGERDHNWVVNLGRGERTLKTAILWWLRNPLHNLFWHVLDWPASTALVLKDMPGFWFVLRPPTQWLSHEPHAQVTIWPIYIGWRGTKWEGYFGWRGTAGRLGFALRRSDRND